MKSVIKDTRKGDRHKTPRKGDRHKTPRKGDRHKNRGPRFVQFAFIDGEAVKLEDGKSSYVYLKISHLPSLISDKPERSLSTKEIFEYIMCTGQKTALIGYVLNYDIENWLRDIPDNAYLYLTGKNDVESDGSWNVVYQEAQSGPFAGQVKQLRNCIEWEGYRIMWIPRKVFELTRLSDKKKVKIQDCWGYCQSSFVKAVKNWKVATDDEIAAIQAGKEGRDVFRWEELPEIQKYNELELELGVRLAKKIFESCRAAIEAVGLDVKISRMDLYGPGAISSKILRSLEWPESVGRYTIPEAWREDFLSTIPEKFLEMDEDGVDNRQREYLLNLQFIASYYGGRIEAAGVGKWDKVYDYDLRSAYPTAISRFPLLDLSTAQYFSQVDPETEKILLDRRYIGMYYISWNLPVKYYWHPFPFRHKTNVFFPPAGRGWVCSPELFAAYDTGFKFTVHKAIIIPGTNGLGGGEKPLPAESMNPAGVICQKMFAVRARLKKEQGKGGAELALKLILNSLYGKLLQQVGRNLQRLGLFNDLVATWITSFTRAQIWRAIAQHAHTRQILSVQTDGIVSTKPLGLDFGDDLGQWEEAEYRDYIQLLPGLYQYKDDKGVTVERTRGMPKGFDFQKAFESLYTKEVYKYTYRVFIGRRIWLSQHFAYKDQLFQWPELTKEFKPDLGSKRLENGNSLAYLNRGQKRIFIKPKTAAFLGNLTSYPFELKFSEEFWVPETLDLLEQALVEETGMVSNFFRE